MICFVAHSAKLSYILARSCEALSGGAWARAFQRSEPWAEHAAPGVRAHTDPLTCSSPYAAQKTGLRWRVRDWGARQLELKPAPATQKRYETNNLPCPPPTRKRKAFAKSREVWDMGGAEPIRHFRPGRPSLAIVLGLARLRLVASFSCRIFSQSLGCSGGFDSGVFSLQLELSQNLGIGVLWAGSFCAMAQDPS